MIYKEVKFYLQTHLLRPSVDFKWTDEENEKLFTYINEKFDLEYLQKKENLLKIKQAFKDFFEPVGYILFKLKDSKIKFRIFPYKLEPKDSINLEAMVNIIGENVDSVEFNYKGKDDQILLNKDLVSKINKYVSNINNEEINKKELVKHSVRTALVLSESDLIINRNSQIFVKKFRYKNILTESQKGTIAGRYNGINEEELRTFEIDYFNTEENKDFFTYVAKSFVEIYLIEQRIDNNYYEAKAFSLIQSIIVDQLTSQFDHNRDFFIGFAGYIFRIHFKDVFAHIADFILHEVSLSNTHMIDFLKYYSLDVIIIGGKKYQIPSLQSDNGQHWNSISILSVAKTYVKTKISVQEITKKFYVTEDKIQEHMIGDLTPLEYNSDINIDVQKVIEKINISRHKLDVTVDSIDSSKDKSRKQMFKQDAKDIREHLDELNKEKDFLINKKIQSNKLNQYVMLQREVDSLDRNYKRESQILEQNEKAYQSIKNALVKALISKKELL